MTYPIFLFVLQQGYLRMGQVNLLVLDECHNAVRDPSLKSIILELNLQKSTPRILGLTASIVNNKCRPLKLAKLIINLENSLKSVIQTSNSILSALQ